VEFNALGALAPGEPVSIWLACGRGADRRYLAIGVDPVTGLASVGDVVAARPPEVAP
jgi:hypothetical protein